MVVEVGAAGVNYIDTYHRGGVYQVDLPLVLGLEGAGPRHAPSATASTDVAVGDRVAWTNTPGSYAEHVAVPADETVPVPDAVDDVSAVGALLQGMTAWILVNTTYPVQPGDDVLVHAAAGGVGLLLTQLATGLGARVIATVSTDEKEELARAAGAAEVLRYSDDLAERVRDLTDGVGVAVAYDGVGKSTFDASMDSLRRRGMLVLFGAASGPVPPVDPQRLNAGGSLYLTRPTLFHHISTREELLATAGSVYAEVADGPPRRPHRPPLRRSTRRARRTRTSRPAARRASWCSFRDRAGATCRPSRTSPGWRASPCRRTARGWSPRSPRPTRSAPASAPRCGRSTRRAQRPARRLTRGTGEAGARVPPRRRPAVHLGPRPTPTRRSPPTTPRRRSGGSRPRARPTWWARRAGGIGAHRWSPGTRAPSSSRR